MKNLSKYVVFLFLFLTLNTGYSYAACELFPTTELRHGKETRFKDYFHNLYTDGTVATIDDYNVDFSGDQNKPPFSLINKTIPANTELLALESSWIELNTKQDFTVTYTIDYSLSGGKSGGTHCEIKPHTVTYCGDGTVQPGYEECEPGQTGPNGQTCNAECEWEEPKPSECTDLSVSKSEIELGETITATCSADPANADKFITCDASKAGAPGKQGSNAPLSTQCTYGASNGYKAGDVISLHCNAGGTKICSATVKIKAEEKDNYCGDGIVQTPNDKGQYEQCDDGTNNGKPGYCKADCTKVPTTNNYCGDGIVQTPNDKGQYEQCDDGSNNGKPGYCGADCTKVPTTNNYCGDGIVQTPNDKGQYEQCDDGTNNGKPGYCRADCTRPTPEAQCSSVTVSSVTKVGDVANIRCTASNVGTYKIIVQDANNTPLKTVNSSYASFTVPSVGSYTAKCFVGKYGQAATQTAPNCNKTFTVQDSGEEKPKCNSLTFSPNPTAPFSTSTLTCGATNAGVYKMIVQKDGKLISEGNSSVLRNVKFNSYGNYTAKCFVGKQGGVANITSPACNKTISLGTPKCENLEVNSQEFKGTGTLKMTCKAPGVNNFKLIVQDRKTGKPVYTQNAKTGEINLLKGDYVAKCFVENLASTSASCQKEVKVTDFIPQIDVVKTDLNDKDIDGTKRNDTQTLKKTDDAVFEITVKNNGEEELKNIYLVDDVQGTSIEAPNCNKNQNEVRALLQAKYNRNTLKPGESFTYTCSRANESNDPKPYINKIIVYGVGVSSGASTTDNDDTVVKVLQPAITVDKTDANPNDFDKQEGNDTQTVAKEAASIFKITVTNNGTEGLKDIILTDEKAPECSGTLDFATKKVGNNTVTFTKTVKDDAILQPGEVFSYTCTLAKTTDSYTNVIEVKGTGINTGETPEAEDPSIVNVVYPEIEVDKADGNPDDLEKNKQVNNPDSQLIVTGDKAVFNITVKNTGTEDLKDVELTDVNAQDCSGKLLGGKVGNNTVTWSGDGNHSDDILQKGEVFTYTCKKDTVEEDFINTIVTTGIGVLSNTETDDDDDTVVKVKNPRIYIDKIDANSNDRDNFTGNDSQLVATGDDAVFKITVVNNGSENLKNVKVEDPKAPECSGTLNFSTGKLGNNTVTFHGQGTHSDDILEVNESFSYTCKKPNTQEHYTNIAKAIAVGVDSGKEVEDEDDSIVDVDTDPDKDPECISIEKDEKSNNRYEYTCTGYKSQEISIDCGNGYVFTGRGESEGNSTYSFSATCNYPKKDTYTPKCIVEGIDGEEYTGDQCETSIEVEDEPYCGDGVKNGNEECDFRDRDSKEGWKAVDGGELQCTRKCEVPTERSYCGDDQVQRPNDDGEYEECDTKESWCSSDCKINTNTLTVPGEIPIKIGPSLRFVIGANMDVFSHYNDTKHVPYIEYNNRDNLNNLEDLSDVYIGELCVVSYKNKNKNQSIEKEVVSCEKVSGDGYLEPREKFMIPLHALKGKVKTIAVPTNKTTDLNVVYVSVRQDVDGQTDPKLFSEDITDEDWGEAYFYARPFEVQVVKSSVAVIGGASTYVPTGDNLSADVSIVSNEATIAKDIAGEPVHKDEIITKNVAGIYIGDGLSADAVTEDANDSISDQNDRYTDTLTDDDVTVNTQGEISNIDKFEKYNGLNNVNILKNKNFKITTTTARELKLLKRPTTFIIENGNLIIEKNIDVDHNIAFVVKGGDIQIDKDVTKLDGTYIAIPKSNNGGNIKPITSGYSDKQLVFKGAVHGNIEPLVASRTYIKQVGDELSVGTIISFGSSVFRNPAPMTSTFIEEYRKSKKVAN